MTARDVLVAARRLRNGQDFSLLVDVWLKEKLELVLSIPVSKKKEVREALTQYHAIREFADFAEQLAQEAEQNG